jgi:D-alanyl-D-alanine carboxypeptidase
VRFFIKEMNTCASHMGLSNTFFDSPHGLANYQNTSTAHDVAILTYKCMEIQLFAEIVRTPFYAV